MLMLSCWVLIGRSGVRHCVFRRSVLANGFDEEESLAAVQAGGSAALMIRIIMAMITVMAAMMITMMV